MIARQQNNAIKTPLKLIFGLTLGMQIRADPFCYVKFNVSCRVNTIKIT